MLAKISKLTIADWRFIAFISLLVGAPLSKYPCLGVPLFNFPSFRIGLYQLVAIIFIFLCLPLVKKVGHTFYYQSNRAAFFGLIVFVIIGVLGLAWALYIARSALLASSVLILVALVFAGWIYTAKELNKTHKIKILRFMLYGSVFYFALAILQLIVFTTTDQTLGILCKGCVADVFGFPRVNGLAAEPQFFANAILPFLFAAIYGIIRYNNKLSWAVLITSAATIGLTFSRGAFFATGIGLIAIFLLIPFKKLASLKQLVFIASTIVLSILVALSLLVISATVRYNNTPNITYETIDSILEHLTLGIINLPEKVIITPQAQPIQTVLPNNNFVSPGLIKSSGQERLGAADLALLAWRSNLKTILLGVGIGNLGPYVTTHIDPNVPNNLTVYIYYVLILAEFGLIGLISALSVFIAALWVLYKKNSLGAFILIGLILSFLAQYLFFGSYINVVYVWLWVGIALGLGHNAKIGKLSNKVYNKPRKKLNEK